METGRKKEIRGRRRGGRARERGMLTNELGRKVHAEAWAKGLLIFREIRMHQV